MELIILALLIPLLALLIVALIDPPRFFPVKVGPAAHRFWNRFGPIMKAIGRVLWTFLKKLGALLLRLLELGTDCLERDLEQRREAARNYQKMQQENMKRSWTAQYYERCAKAVFGCVSNHGESYRLLAPKCMEQILAPKGKEVTESGGFVYCIPLYLGTKPPSKGIVEMPIKKGIEHLNSHLPRYAEIYGFEQVRITSGNLTEGNGLVIYVQARPQPEHLTGVGGNSNGY